MSTLTLRDIPKPNSLRTVVGASLIFSLPLLFVYEGALLANAAKSAQGVVVAIPTFILLGGIPLLLTYLLLRWLRNPGRLADEKQTYSFTILAALRTVDRYAPVEEVVLTSTPEATTIRWKNGSELSLTPSTVRSFRASIPVIAATECTLSDGRVVFMTLWPTQALETARSFFAPYSGWRSLGLSSGMLMMLRKRLRPLKPVDMDRDMSALYTLLATRFPGQRMPTISGQIAAVVNVILGIIVGIIALGGVYILAKNNLSSTNYRVFTLCISILITIAVVSVIVLSLMRSQRDLTRTEWRINIPPTK